MLGVDDMPVIFVIKRMLAKHTADLFLDETQQLIASCTRVSTSR